MSYDSFKRKADALKRVARKSSIEEAAKIIWSRHGHNAPWDDLDKMRCFYTARLILGYEDKQTSERWKIGDQIIFSDNAAVSKRTGAVLSFMMDKESGKYTLSVVCKDGTISFVESPGKDADSALNIQISRWG